MKDDAIVKDIINDINNMSLEELKEMLLTNANGPIYQAVSFNPYEALYDCFYDVSGSYKLSKVFDRNDFMKLINSLDLHSKIATKITAANDECFNYSLAA